MIWQFYRFHFFTLPGRQTINHHISFSVTYPFEKEDILTMPLTQGERVFSGLTIVYMRGNTIIKCVFV